MIHGNGIKADGPDSAVDASAQKPEKFCRLSTTPDKSCVCVDNNWCKACNTGFAGTFYQSFEVCPCPSQMQPVIRKSRMDELIEEWGKQYFTAQAARNIFAPAVDALERLEKAKKEGLAVMRMRKEEEIIIPANTVEAHKLSGWKLIGYVVEDK